MNEQQSHCSTTYPCWNGVSVSKALGKEAGEKTGERNKDKDLQILQAHIKFKKNK